MASFTPDPVLDRLSILDPAGYRAVLDDLIAVLPGSIVGYAALNPADIAVLASEEDEAVRAGIAAREDCPPEVLADLARDSHAAVRQAVAGHPQVTAAIIQALAADPDQWVRWAVARRVDLSQWGIWEQLAQDPEDLVSRQIAMNPACPEPVLMSLVAAGDFGVRWDMWSNPALSDSVKAALVLSGVEAPENYRLVAEWNATGNLPTDHDQLRTLLNHPGLDTAALRAILDQVGAGPNTYAVRSSLAEHPSADEDLLADLVRKATYRWEWRSLWKRYYPDTWPSTLAMASPAVSDATRAALNMAGHPAGLISTDLPPVPCFPDAPEGLAQLIRSELLVRALWRELALSGTFAIQAWNDNLEGNKFFLDVPGEDAGSGPIGYLLGGYSEDREWAQMTSYLDEHDAQRAFANLGEEWEFEGVEEWQLDEAMCAFISNAADWTDDLTITPAGAAFILETASEMDFDSEDLSTKVTIVESALPHIGFGAAAPAKQDLLLDLLLDARSQVLLGEWGLVDHFLTCLQHHPSTCQPVRARLDQILGKPSV